MTQLECVNGLVTRQRHGVIAKELIMRPWQIFFGVYGASKAYNRQTRRLIWRPQDDTALEVDMNHCTFIKLTRPPVR